jgi:hypothetical protein
VLVVGAIVAVASILYAVRARMNPVRREAESLS